MRIVEFDAFGRKLYIFTAHISAIMTNAPEKGTRIFIDDDETPFYVTEDVETVLWKIKASTAGLLKEY
jgi:hypothetical protein